MQRFDLKRFRLDRKLTQKELAEILMCKQNYISNIENGIKPISKEKAGADAFSRQVVKMMNDKLIAPYGMLVEKDKEIERLNRLIGRLQNEIEELKKGSAQMENPAGCANAV